MDHAEGVRYLLPRRSMGLFGAIPFILGIPGVGMALCVDWNKVREIWWGPGLIMTFQICGWGALFVGIHLVLGRAVIELGRGRLRAASKVFGIGWWRSRPVDQITRVEASRVPIEYRGPPPTSGPLRTLARLEACGVGPKRFLLAMNYDLRILAPLASDLNRRLKG